MTLVVTARARSAIRRIGEWWKANRDAKRLFEIELADAFELITQTPGVGEPWSSQRVAGVRRWLLPKTHYHVYYTVDETRSTVAVRMIWYAGRGRQPKL